MIKLFRDLFRRTRPRSRYYVTAMIWNEQSQRYIGKLTVTTDASSRAEAKRIVEGCLQLHITDSRVVKEKVNGSH